MKMLLIIVLILCLGTQTIRCFEENSPRFLSEGHEIIVQEGTHLELFCDVEHLGQFVILWKFNRSQVLFAGNLRIHRDDRIIRNHSTNALTIRNIQMEDTGHYRFDFSFFNNNYVKYLFFLTISCLISTNPPQEIVYTINVISKSFINTLKI
jgi:hypothetical protein